MSLVRKSVCAIVVANLAISTGIVKAGEFGESRIGLELLQLDRKTDQDVVYVWDRNYPTEFDPQGHSNDIPKGTTSRFDETADIGFRLEGAHKLSSRWSIQAGYITTGKLSESQVFSDPSGQLDIFWAPATNEFDGAENVQADYNSELDGFDLNIVYSLSDHIDFFGGIGQLDLDEQFNIVSNDIHETGIGRYNISTSNEMLGTQLGINLDYAATEKLGVYLLAKMGWYENKSEQRQTVNEPIVVSNNRDVTVNDDTSSVAYELRLGGIYDLKKNISINFGYQYLKVTDVALAESQFDVQTGGTTLSNSDDITWQGMQLGINYYF